MPPDIVAPAVVSINQLAPHGTTCLQLQDAGSTAEQLVQMLRRAMLGCGFPEAVVERVRFDGHTITDENYGGSGH